MMMRGKPIEADQSKWNITLVHREFELLVDSADDSVQQVEDGLTIPILDASLQQSSRHG